jgi:outer membrane protein assembly factor BamB
MQMAAIASWVGPAIVASVGGACILQWIVSTDPNVTLTQRQPVQAQSASSQRQATDLKGQFKTGPGQPGKLHGSWPNFRGAARDNVNPETVHLARNWPTGAPPKRWQIDAAEGYAGTAVVDGRAYLLDYDTDMHADVLRCLSTDDGKEIWRRSYVVDTPRNHGITRTVCAVRGGKVVSIGPRCHVLCVDAITGDFKWGLDLVRDFGTTEPPWYTGQNPLIDGRNVIIAPGGPVLMIAVDLDTGAVVWKTPNPRKSEMTHSSIVPVTLHGQRVYLYCASGALVGVKPDDGSLLFELSDWKVSMANVPSPLPLPGDRVMLTGGYGAGSAMVQFDSVDGKLIPRILYRLPPEVFGAEQHTPIFYNGYIYGVIPAAGAGQLVCLSLDGKQMWAAPAKYHFGLGSYLLADGLLLLHNDTGTLTAVEATETAFKPLGTAKLFDHGHDSWGPMALVQGRLFARDMTRVACFDLREVTHD